MKQVSILWQKMSSKEKMEFQEQSKKDRERYENERQEFVQKRQEDSQIEESLLLSHSLLDTLKNRSKIIEQKREQRRMSDEMHQHEFEDALKIKQA